MRQLKHLLLLISIFSFCNVSGQDGRKWAFDYMHGKRKIKVWAYRAKVVKADAKVVFVMHGTKRNGETYLEPWMDVADRHKAYILVPEFSKEDWPYSRSYNYGNVVDSKGKLIPRNQWSLTAIDAIFNRFKLSNRVKTKGYCIFGHSAGSQFVHRMVILAAAKGLELAVAANAGTYTMTDFEVKWPYGLADSPVNKSSLKIAFSKNLHVLIGELDTGSKHKYLPHTKEAMAQGKHRFERANKFFSIAKATAEEHKFRLNWQLQIVPNVGHYNKKMVPAAEKLIFAK